MHSSFSEHRKQRCTETLPGLMAALLQEKEKKEKRRRVFVFVRLNIRFGKPWCEHQIKLRLKRVYVCANSLTQQKPQDAHHDQNATYAIPEPQLHPAVLNYPS